jgi:hypothetical protein
MWRSVALRRCRRRVARTTGSGTSADLSMAGLAGCNEACAACLELALAAAYRRKPLRWSRGCMLAKFSNHADGL